MSQATVLQQGISAGSHQVHRSRLFIACLASMFATSFGFIVRANLLDEFATTFHLDEVQKGAINGAGLFPFAISIILISLFIDRIGYGMGMVFAFVGHVLGTVLLITATSYGMLYIGTLILALANGAIEAVVNPVTATLYADKKTHYLNILHAGWPGGLVLAGIATIVIGDHLTWQWKVGMVLIPTVIYGVLLLGQRFPVQERVAAGVSYNDMMKEFGAAGALVISYFLTQSLITVATVFMTKEAQQADSFIQLSAWLPIIVAVVAGLAFFAVYKSFGRPMFVFLLFVMILLATTELGVDSWVTSLMRPIFGANAPWILVYTSAIMFVLRFCAGPIVHRLNPLGLLCICAALASVGLYSISAAGAAIGLVFAAATLYGIAKSFFWPTTLGIVSEQFPRGGALTLNAMGGMGMIAVGVLGGPFLGTVVEKGLDTALEKKDPSAYTILANKNETTKYGMTYHTVDMAKVGELSATQKEAVNAVQGEVKQGVLAKVALLPATMFVCYLGLIIYFAARGGYKAVHLTAGQETGGIEGPGEA